MDIDMLIGVDLWARTRRAIPPPPIRRAPGTPGVHQIEQTGAADEKRWLENFLREELRKFDRVQKLIDKTEHIIRLKRDVSLKQRYRLRNSAMQTIIDKDVEQILCDGVIEPSNSAWSSPIVIRKKRDEKSRFPVR